MMRSSIPKYLPHLTCHVFHCIQYLRFFNTVTIEAVGKQFYNIHCPLHPILSLYYDHPLALF